MLPSPVAMTRPLWITSMWHTMPEKRVPRRLTFVQVTSMCMGESSSAASSSGLIRYWRSDIRKWCPRGTSYSACESRMPVWRMASAMTAGERKPWSPVWNGWFSGQRTVTSNRSGAVRFQAERKTSEVSGRCTSQLGTAGGLASETPTGGLWAFSFAYEVINMNSPPDFEADSSHSW